MSQLNSANTGFRQVVRDIIDLFELQMQLLSVDSQEARRKSVRAAILVGIAAPLIGSMLTVLMIGCGFVLHENAGLQVGVSMLAVGLAVAVLAMILLLVALKLFKAAAASMGETKSEFAENLRWLKAVLVSPNTSPRNQLRAESFDRPSARPRSDHGNTVSFNTLDRR